LVAACCLAVQLAVPVPAQAWWEWLDQLSGPGPFIGWDLQWRVKCVPDTRPGVEDLKLDNIESDARRAWARVVGAGCLFEPAVNPLGSVNFAVGQLYSVNNDLRYASNTASRRVTMTRFEPSLSMFVDSNKFVEITSGMGVMLVSGPAFDRFHRFYWRPLRVTITPGRNALSVSFGMLLLPRGFDAEDFGAIRGTFHTDKEVLGTAELSLDLSRLGKRRPSR
jgi:hypothetical protein